MQFEPKICNRNTSKPKVLLLLTLHQVFKAKDYLSVIIINSSIKVYILKKIRRNISAHF